MAAGRAAECGAQVILLEKMAQTGRKIGISGKGRCNLTNSAELTEFISHFGKNGNFLRQCFNHFFVNDLIVFFEEKGLSLVPERGGRIFPKSGRALDVVKTLNQWLNQHNVSVRKKTPVDSIVIQDKRVKGVICNGSTLTCDTVILATGGKSYPRTGSTGDGYKLAKDSGHSLIPPKPTLVPLVSNNAAVRRLNGLDLKNITVRLYINGKRKSQNLGEISFTKTGVSGPLALNLSKTVIDSLDRGDKISLSIDLKPGLDDKKLANRLIRDFEKRGGEPIKSLLRGLILYQLVDVCLESCQIPPDIDTKTFPAKMRKKLALWLKDFRFGIDGYRDFDEAIVTSGGVNLKEINPKTMESKLVTGLFIVGELLDIQADTGGFNLQAAFSTGWLAGSSQF